MGDPNNVVSTTSESDGILKNDNPSKTSTFQRLQMGKKPHPYKKKMKPVKIGVPISTKACPWAKAPVEKAPTLVIGQTGSKFIDANKPAPVSLRQSIADARSEKKALDYQEKDLKEQFVDGEIQRAIEASLREAEEAKRREDELKRREAELLKQAISENQK